jgi:hypothetical protein
VCVVHQPGDVLIAVPATAAVAALGWRNRAEPGWGAAGLAIFALAVPFAHLYVVDSAVVSAFGSRAAVTVDGVAVVASWCLLVFAAVRLTGVRATRAVAAGSTG